MRIDLRSPHLALTVATILLAAIAAVLLGFWHLDGRGSIINRLEAWLLDWRFEIVGPRPAPENLLIVAIDDETVRRAGAYPLPRATLGRLVRTLIEGGAQVVAIDLLFLDRGAGDADAELASAFSTGRVVIAAAALFGAENAIADTQVGPAQSVTLPSANRVLLPISTLASAAAAGVVNIATDHSGTPQHIPLLIRSGQELFPSFVLRAAALATQAEPRLGADAVNLGNTRSSLDLGFHLPIRFYGRRGTVRTISAAHVLERGIGDAARGRTVVIGVTAVGVADTFATPFDPILPGVEVLSTGIGHLTTGHGLTRNLATRRIDAAFALFLPIATILLLSLPQIGVGIILAIGLMLLWGVCAVVAFYYDYWLTMALPLVTAVPAALGYGAVRLWLEQRIERRLEIQQKALRRFHHPALAEKLIAAPDFLEEPVQQHAAVLFIDLSGFTGLSEQLGAQRTRSFLKEFHSLIEDQATRHEGFVLSFMGDGAMLVFGLPAPKADDAWRAIEAARALSHASRAWLAARPVESGRTLGARLGLHYGAVVLSRLGADTHQHITATGDTVNVASRLLEVAKQHGSTLAVSTDAIAAARDAGHDTAPLLSLGEIREVVIRGRARPLSVWLGHAVTTEKSNPAI